MVNVTEAVIEAAQPADRYILIREMSLLTGLSRSTLYREERLGRFPRRRQLTSGRIAWLESEVLAWQLSRPHVLQSPAA